MGVSHAGSLDFEEEAQSDESIDDFGLITLNRVFSGPRYRLENFLEPIEDGDPDEEFPDLTLVRRRISIRYDGPHAYVTLHFKGIRGAGIKPKRRKGLVTKTAVLTSPSGATVTLTYKAPFTTFLYATEKEPIKSRFINQLLNIKGGTRIIAIEGPPDADIRAVASGASVMKGDFLYRPELIQATFKAEEEGGAWQVEETNEVEIFDARRLMLSSGSIIPRTS